MQIDLHWRLLATRFPRVTWQDGLDKFVGIPCARAISLGQSRCRREITRRAPRSAARGPAASRTRTASTSLIWREPEPAKAVDAAARVDGGADAVVGQQPATRSRRGVADARRCQWLLPGHASLSPHRRRRSRRLDSLTSGSQPQAMPKNSYERHDGTPTLRRLTKLLGGALDDGCGPTRTGGESKSSTRSSTW